MLKTKRILLISVLSLFSCGLPLLHSFAAPDIRFEEQEHDFGEVDENEKVTHVFRFKNEGDKTLIISEVSAGCKCTQVISFSKETPAGKTGEIKVVFDTEGYQDKVGQTISVRSNDPDKSLVKLRIFGFVKKEIIVRPHSVYFRGYPKAEPLVREVFFFKGKDKDFKILKVETDSEFLGIYSPVPVARDDRTGYMVKLSLNPNVPMGDFKTDLTVYTDSSEQPKITVPVRADVEGELSVTPPRLFFLPLAGKETKVRSLEFHSMLDQTVEVTQVKTDLQQYIITQLKPAEAGRYEVVVELKDNIPHKRISGVITLDTNYAKQPKIEVPVVIYNEEVKRR